MSDALRPVRDPRPLAVQVYDELYKAIHSKSDSLKGEIPTETSLTRQLGVSRTTVRTALALLEEDGLLARGPGRRRHVVKTDEHTTWKIPTLEQLFINNQTSRLDVMQRQEVPATRWGASKLEVPSGSPLIVWSSKIYDGDVIVCDSIELTPKESAPGKHEENRSLLDSLGIDFVSECTYQSIKLGPYSNQTRDDLPVDVSAPRVVITLVLSREGKPVYLAKHVALLDRMPISLLNP